MKPLPTVLAAGLLAAGAGCSNLRQGLAFRSVPDRVAAAPAPSAGPELKSAMAAAPGPIDPFHAAAETPSGRLSRFFPGLSRTEKAQPPAAPSAYRPGSTGKPRDRKLEAVPRPDPADGESATAARTGQGSDSEIRPAALAPQPAMPRPNPIAGESAPPLLAAAVVAEADPGEDRPEAIEPAPAARTRRTIRMVDAAPSRPAGSDRDHAPDPFPRMSGDLDPTKLAGSYGISIRRIPSELGVPPDRDRGRSAAIASRGEGAEPASSLPAGREEDRDARRAKVDVVEARPDSPRRNLEPPQDDSAPASEPIEPVREPTEVASMPEPEGRSAIADEPPPIDTTESAGPAASGRDRGVRGLDSGDDPALAGRRRLDRGDVARNSLPPDLPPVRFPRTYYEGGDPSRRAAIAGGGAKVDDQTRPARWTWKPRLFRRLRGDDPATDQP